MPSTENQPDLPDEVLWPAYIPLWEKTDKSLSQTWDLEANGIIVFASLFSATVATFLVESFDGLKPDSPDSGEMTVLLLTQIYQHLSENTTGQPYPSLASETPSNVPASAVLVNTFWVISLILSLFTAISAIVLQQSLRRYLDRQQGIKESKIGTLTQRARAHFFLLSGARRWGLINALRYLTIILHIAFFLFLAGLVLFFSDANTTVYHASLAASIAVATIYAVISAFPLLHPGFPYSTPLTPVFSWVLSFAVGIAAFAVYISVVLALISLIYGICIPLLVLLCLFALVVGCVLICVPSRKSREDTSSSLSVSSSTSSLQHFGNAVKSGSYVYYMFGASGPWRVLWDQLIHALNATSVLLVQQNRLKRIFTLVDAKKEAMDRELLNGLAASLKFVIGGRARHFDSVLVSQGFATTHSSDYILWNCSDWDSGIRELFSYITLCRLHLCVGQRDALRGERLVSFLRAVWRMLDRMAKESTPKRRQHIMGFLTYGQGPEDAYIALHGGCGQIREERPLLHLLDTLQNDSDKTVALLDHCVLFLALQVTCIDPLSYGNSSRGLNSPLEDLRFALTGEIDDHVVKDFVSRYVDESHIVPDCCKTLNNLQVNAPFYFLIQFIIRISPYLSAAQDDEIELVEDTLNIAVTSSLQDKCSKVHPSTWDWFLEELDKLRAGNGNMGPDEISHYTRLADRLSPLAEAMRSGGGGERGEAAQEKQSVIPAENQV